MKHLLVLAIVGAFGASILGCHASAGVDAPDDHGGTVSKTEKTTVSTPSGERTTEVHTTTP